MTRAENSFVLFPMGNKRFALPASEVAELARPDRLQTFPHTTPLIAGVLVRRGQVIPVCDVAPVLVGSDAPARKFYLIATRRLGAQTELTAVPVTGECELVKGESGAPPSTVAEYVSALLTLGTETVQVIDLDKLIAAGGEA